MTKLVATVVLTSGIEMIGFIDGFTSMPKLDDDGVLRANNIIGELVEVKNFRLETPLRSVSIPTPNGQVANVLAPPVQTSKTQVDALSVFIRAHDLLFIGDANEGIEERYRQQFSAIALPTGAGRLTLAGGNA